MLQRQQKPAHIVLQSLDDFDAVVAEVQLAQIHQALQPLNLGQTVILQVEQLFSTTPNKPKAMGLPGGKSFL